MKTIVTLTSTMLLILLTQCSPDKETVENTNEPAIAVEVKSVQNNSDNSFITTSGKVQAIQSTNLSTRTMGYITRIHVNVGDKVSKGQLLISINNSDLQAKKAQVDATIAKAKAACNAAEKDYNRYKNLFDKKSVSQKELDDVTTNLNVARANLDAAKQMKNEVNAQFAYTNIRAPFSGTITNKHIDQGALANPGQMLLSIEGKNGLEVVSMVPETEISKIKNGIPVKVVIKSVDKLLEGKVVELSSSAKNTGGQYMVKIELNKTDENVLSGMFASVQFPIENKAKENNSIIIPKDVLHKRGQLCGVYTVSQNNTAILRWLRLGRSFGDHVEVLSGLSFGEQYISHSEEKLYNGAKILIKQ